MEFTTIIFLCVGLTTAYGTKCEDISGIWENELGSRMILNVGDSNRISGEYYTAVESSPGDAAIVSNITGLFSKQKDGALLAFSVLFNHGLSLTTWVGQCTICGDQEVIHTTYNLRRYARNSHEKWTSVIVNQNTFRRIGDEQNAVESSTKRFSPLKRSLSQGSPKHSGGLEVNGKWKSNDNGEIEIFGDKEGILEGKHQTTDLIGRKDGNESFTAVGMVSTLNKKIRSWTGFVYTSVGFPHTLEVSWLEHEFNPSCESPRKMVMFGLSNFTRPTTGTVNMSKPETFMEKIKKFFSSIF